MPRGLNHKALHDAALLALKCLGYRYTPYKIDGCGSRQVYLAERDGVTAKVLVQGRHNQPDDQRYLVGLIIDAVRRVDHVTLYFQGESTMFIIPAAVLLKMHEERCSAGDARYTGPLDEQWRVDVYVSDEKLSPQGSGGVRYDLSEWAFRVPDASRRSERAPTR